MNSNNSQRKSSHSDRPPEQEIWREKYLSTLDEFEQEQTEANATIDILRRGLLSVSLAGDGLDTDLDQKLTQLRSQLKTAQNYPSVSSLLQTIEADLIRLDTEKLEHTKTHKKYATEAINLLLSSSIDSEVKKELKAFNKKVKSSENNSELARQFESDLFKLLLPLLLELSSNFSNENPSEGLWDRFKKSVNAKSGDTLTNQGATKDTIETPSSDISVVRADTEENHNIQLLDETKSLICKLVGSVYGNPALSSVAKALSQEISVADAASLLKHYPKVTNLIELSQTQDKKVFLDYLGEINFSLSRISQSIGESKVANRRLLSQKRKDSQRLRGGIEKIRDILDTASDLEDLKIQTQSKLDDIVETIENSSINDEKIEQTLDDLSKQQAAELEQVTEKTKTIGQRFELSALDQEDDIDTITKLKNKTALMEALTSELARHQAKEEALCLCIADVRSLQSLNDQYGKNAGDKALELLAREIEAKTTKTDFLAYGGDGHFLLLKPQTLQSEAETQIEQLDRELAKLPFRFKGNEVNVTLSFASIQSTVDDSAHSLLDRTTKALEQVKLQITP